MSNEIQIGGNVKLLRADLSQADLAKTMREAGFNWSQSTVWSVEKGTRPLRLSEAIALASILGAPLEDLAMVNRDDLDRRQAFRDRESALNAFEAAQRWLNSADARINALVKASVPTGTE